MFHVLTICISCIALVLRLFPTFCRFDCCVADYVTERERVHNSIFFCVFPFCFVSVSHDSRATHCKKKRVRRVGPPTPSAHSPDSESKLASSVCMRELNERIFASWISECLAFYTFHLRHANSMKFDSQTEHQRAMLVCDARVTVGWKVCLYTSSTWMLFRFNPSRFHHGCTRSNKNKSPAQTKHRL